MNDITFSKVKELSLEVHALIDSVDLKKSDFEDMIEVIGKLESKVECNKSFYPDWDKIISLCKLMIFKLMLKITEVLELEFSHKTILQ